MSLTEERNTSGSLSRALLSQGVSRRDFLKFCSAMTGVLALPVRYTPRIAHAIETAVRPPVIWLNFQDCAGNSESFLRANNPSVSELVLDILSVDYQEVIMAAAGHYAEENRLRTMEQFKGQYIVVVEGSIPTAEDGIYCVIGGHSAMDTLRETTRHAAVVITAGTCSAYGGIPAAAPNPTGAVGVRELINNVPLINLPGCPMNVQNLTAVIVHYLTFNTLPATDQEGRPLFAYGSRIHDDCERRAHFDAGQFVEEWGDEAHRKGWCLYKMGCKGPETFHNCSVIRWNDGYSWPVQAGHGCVGCAEPHFWDNMGGLYERLPNVKPPIGAEVSADQIGAGFVGLVAGGLAAHAIASGIRAKVDPIDREVTEVEEDTP